MSKRYDSAESTRLLLEASAVEFARKGVHGARIDQIADRAGVNKASIYSYIGNKEDLFEAAIAAKLGELANRVTIGQGGLPEYVGDLFDFLCENPIVAWLFEQEALHFAPDAVPDFAQRAAYFQTRVAATADALGGDSDAAATFFALISMCYWFVAAPQLVGMIFGDAAPEGVRRRYRAHLVATATAMSRLSSAETGAQAPASD
ncbi:TetR/AcrR family transcriptional regulator [Leifsonia sp. NPDC056665]|uniref:TetR/AcrR family transcriptional regulator n=1 Tax=Leifsonia sp. NPDC056665 TaxID=3345901 RepID=UPI00367D1596